MCTKNTKTGSTGEIAAHRRTLRQSELSLLRRSDSLEPAFILSIKRISSSIFANFSIRLSFSSDGGAARAPQRRSIPEVYSKHPRFSLSASSFWRTRSRAPPRCSLHSSRSPAASSEFATEATPPAILIIKTSCPLSCSLLVTACSGDGFLLARNTEAARHEGIKVGESSATKTYKNYVMVFEWANPLNELQTAEDVREHLEALQDEAEQVPGKGTELFSRLRIMKTDVTFGDGDVRISCYWLMFTSLGFSCYCAHYLHSEGLKKIQLWLIFLFVIFGNFRVSICFRIQPIELYTVLERGLICF